MDDLEFLRLKPAGQASLTVTLPDGVVSTIEDINLEVIAEKCPLLGLAFEPGPRGPKYSIEEASTSLVASFLRFLYLGNYSCLDTYGFPKSCSLLLHAQLCRMGENYDVPELSSMAHVKIIHETQESCSYPTPPIELCEAIRFLYTKLRHQQPLIDTILHYCVSCFSQHKLGTNEEFCKLVYDLVPFHKDLFKTNYQRRFEDEGAIDIVRLPSCKTQPAPQLCRDFVFELFGCWPEDGQATPKARSRRPTETDSSSDERPFCLVHRPKNPFSDAAVLTSSDSELSATEDEGFTLVFRPKTCKSQPRHEPDPQVQSKVLRTFDPSTPCGPASPYPQKIIRGFEPVKSQPAFAQQADLGVAGDICTVPGGTSSEPVLRNEQAQKARMPGVTEAFSTNSPTESSGDNPLEGYPDFANASLEENNDSGPVSERRVRARPISVPSSPSKPKLSPSALSFTPRPAAFKSKVKKTTTSSNSKAQSDAAKRVAHALEEELRNTVEENEVMPNQAFDSDEDLINLRSDVERKASVDDALTSDSEWSMV